MALARLAFCLLAAEVFCAPIILAPLESKKGDAKLMLLVPGGKVPPEDYLPLAKGAQAKSSLPLTVGIARCHINLCDAIFEVAGLLEDIIATVNKTAQGALRPEDVFITGHSLGGTGARHFFDGYPGAAGLVLFGTQYNGDHEDFKGTLGYPLDLKAFPGPLLALTGELDMVPISHTAELVRQWQALGVDSFVYAKLPIIVEGMDHSQFCPPFEVSGDVRPEISNDAAIAAASDVLASWLDAVVSKGADSKAVQLLKTYADKTAPIASPFIKAREFEETWCATAQQLLVGGLPNLTVVTEHCYDSTSLEHCHTKAEVKAGVLTVTVCDYIFFSVNSTIPNFAPTYQGPQDISCKMVSEDKIAKELGQPMPDMSTDAVMNRCAELNRVAFSSAKDGILAKHWPKAVERYEAQGKSVVFAKDSQALIGPQWLLSGLGFEETDTQLEVTSEALVSPLTSRFFPGNHYCKLLAPSKAVEFVMTRGLTKRYSGKAGGQDNTVTQVLV